MLNFKRFSSSWKHSRLNHLLFHSFQRYHFHEASSFHLFEKSRLKTPTILQMEATECGAAALGIILAHYKKYVTLEELRVACGVSRDGSKAINMLKAARNYGMEAYGAEGDLESLADIKTPFIVFWRFNHFVVVEDINKEKNLVFINDPASGRRAISLEEFGKGYTGVLLVIEPGSNFKPGGVPPSIIRGLKDRFLSSISDINFIILISLSLIFPGILIPGFSKIFIDDIIIKGNKNWLVLFLIGLFLTAVLRGIFSGIQQYYLLRLNLKLMVTGSVKLLWHAFRLPITFFEQRYAGDISERLSANDRISQLLSNDVSASIVSIISMVFYLIIMFLYDYVLALIAIITFIFNVAILYWVSNLLQSVSRRFLQERGKLQGIEINGLRAIETLKSAAMDNVFFRRWSGNHAKIIDSQQKISLYFQFLSSLPTLATGLSIVLILGVGGFRVIDGIITIGTLVAFQSLYASFNEPLATLLGIGSKIQQIPGDIARIEDVLHQNEDPRFLNILVDETKEKIQESAGRSEKNKVETEDSHDYIIQMRDVSFGFSPLDPPLIKNFNLNLKKGGKVALVGATGSGKSTVAKLITGLYQSGSGIIKIDQKNLKELSPSEIAEYLSYVAQDIMLFAGTIRENLTLWENTIPNTELERATKDACIYDVLKHRPHLFDASMEEGGANFSGGERSRLEIARALVRNPKILILDEATATLDLITENKIIDNLKSSEYGILMITHRLSSIIDADEIIVLDKGLVVERGTHEVLMKQRGYYAKLYI